MKNKKQPKIKTANNSKATKAQNSSIFQKFVLFGSSIIGIITILVISTILVLFSIYAFNVLKQNQKFSDAQQSCGRDPVVVIESVSWLYENKSYDIYTPENPEYENVKTTVSNSFSSTKVFGYYCSIEEARDNTKNIASYIADNADNYTTEEKQKIVKDYVSEQSNKGVKFYAPTESLKGFRENVKVIRVKFGMYNIGYVGNTPETIGRGEQVPINLNCNSINEKLKNIKIGEIVGYHPNGLAIYQEEDTYNLNTRLYLPTVECSLETKVGEINKDDAVNLMKTIEEVDSSIIETYEMDFY